MTANERKICLLETAAAGSQIGAREIVSLSPEASYVLEKRGVVFSIPEDYYDEKDIFTGEDAYFKEQLEWFDRFDALFREKVAGCAHEKAGLATAHYYRIKCFVDALVIYSGIFDRLIGKLAAGDVLYISPSSQDSIASIYDPFDRQKDILRPLARKICEKCGVKFSMLEIPREAAEENPADLIKEQAKNALKKLHVKSFYRFLKYGKWENLAGKCKEGGLGILSLHAGCMPLDRLMADAMKSGARVFLKEAGRIDLISSPLEKEGLDLTDLKIGYGAIKVEKEFEGVLEAFMREPGLAGWISAKCGVDVSRIIRPYFQDLIMSVCLRDVTEIPVIRDFMERESIDIVVARSSSERGTVSSLMAASAGRKRVCLQHSCGAYRTERDNVSEFALFDGYFTMHGEAEENVRAIVKGEYAGKCAVYQAPYQMKAVREKWSGDKRDEKLIMYIPTKLFLGFRTFNGYLYPVTWYYKFQKALIDLFCEKKDLRFIFKYAPGQAWSAGSIVPYIQGKNAPNITIEEKPVSECLGKAGRVFLDYPSTSLYEAASAGIPVMSLYHEMMEIMPASSKLFGRSLRKFSDIADAMRAAEEFLSSDPALYKVDIPMADVDVVEVLKGIKAGKQ